MRRIHLVSEFRVCLEAISIEVIIRTTLRNVKRALLLFRDILEGIILERK